MWRSLVKKDYKEPLINYYACLYGVKNRLVRESDQNAHLLLVNSAFSLIFALSSLRSLR